MNIINMHNNITIYIYIYIYILPSRLGKHLKKVLLCKVLLLRYS